MQTTEPHCTESHYTTTLHSYTFSSIAISSLRRFRNLVAYTYSRLLRRKLDDVEHTHQLVHFCL